MFTIYKHGTCESIRPTKTNYIMMKLDLTSEKYKGLTTNQVKEKLRTEGYNSLPSSKPKNFLSIVVGVVKEPMFILLVACGSLYLVLGELQEGLMLLGFVFVIMGIEFFQQKKTEKALDALKDMASPRALVIRDGVDRKSTRLNSSHANISYAVF